MERGMKCGMKLRPPARCRAGGFTLIEVVTALAVLGVGVLAVAGVFVQGQITSHSQSDLTQATVVCQSQMEALRNYHFADSELAVGGSLTSAVSGYSDQVDSTGQEVTAANGLTPVYNRWWQISVDSTGTLKTIAVRCADVAARGPIVSDITVVDYRSCDPINTSCP